ncbi:GntR family transcriptional regulator [Micromonospora inyonensis]|uniref:GntR family transcriptional regulator n=1 Tax=Micromonospora inyonensis TaxID=47866 RepID=UPI003CCBDEA7
MRDGLRARIRTDLLKPGVKLPSTRMLVDQYSTDSAPLRRAVNLMIETSPWYAWTGRGPVGAPAC